VHAQVHADGVGFDLWVGAPGQDYGRGAVYLFRNAHEGGRSTGEQDLVLRSETPNDRLGTGIFPCADLDPDPEDGNVPELALTAPWFATPPSWAESELLSGSEVPPLAGAVFVVRSDQVNAKDGEWAPWDVGRTWWGDEVGDGAGTSVVCDRDIDGDGLVDVVIGSPWARADLEDAPAAQGRITVVSGNPIPTDGPLSSLAGSRTIDGPEGTQDWFGISLATFVMAEDSVGLAVGGAGFDLGAGQVHLYDGANLNTRFASFASELERELPDHFGRWLYSGDLDADGLGDLVVGAPDYKGDGRKAFDAGHLWIWYGADRDEWQIGDSSSEADLQIAGTEPFTRIGRSVTVADTDGDGIDELWVPTGLATER
jgi:hypothetical protein